MESEISAVAGQGWTVLGVGNTFTASCTLLVDKRVNSTAVSMTWLRSTGGANSSAVTEEILATRLDAVQRRARCYWEQTRHLSHKLTAEDMSSSFCCCAHIPQVTNASVVHDLCSEEFDFGLYIDKRKERARKEEEAEQREKEAREKEAKEKEEAEQKEKETQEKEAREREEGSAGTEQNEQDEQGAEATEAAFPPWQAALVWGGVGVLGLCLLAVGALLVLRKVRRPALPPQHARHVALPPHHARHVLHGQHGHNHIALPTRGGLSSAPKLEDNSNEDDSSQTEEKEESVTDSATTSNDDVSEKTSSTSPATSSDQEAD